MCLEDIKIMARSNGFTGNQTVLTSASELISPSMNRIGIIFCPHDTDQYWISTDPAVAVGRGICIPADGSPVMLDVFKHGDLCRRRWHGISVAGTIAVAVIELHLDTELAREAKYGEA